MNRIVRQISVRAFTLVELMISIAIVVVLMVGITKVFSLTSNTAGATQQIASSIRDGRAAQTMFFNDLSNAASDMPFMILRSSAQPAFRNKQDKLSDRDGDVTTIDIDGNNIEGEAGVPGEKIKATDVNNRNHRVDVFSYFARGLFPRQTGNSPDVYLADMSSQEAWIWYGHLRLANNAGSNYYDPGDTTAGNDNNLYASDFVLGRETVLLKTPSAAGVITDRQGISQAFVGQGSVNLGCNSSGSFTVTGGNVAPFGYSSISTDGLGTLSNMQSSRYDLAGASIGGIAKQLSDYLVWLTTNDPSHTANWWTQLMTGDLMAAGTPTVSARFQAKTYVGQPMQSSDMAFTSPLFVQNCSQFIVEYAGDYLNQNPATGAVLGVYSAPNNGTDGQIDYYYDAATGNRKIRWYGLPRDTAGNLVTGGADGKVVNTEGDVTPLRDLWVQAATYRDTNNPNSAPFEKTLPTSTASTDYTGAAGSPAMVVTSPMPSYECVWGPSDPKPKMIRITMTIDDPSGRLPDGQTFQYVIALH